MGCEEIREILDAYALGALNADEAKVVEAHVAGCRDCWHYLDRASQVVGLLPLAVPLRRASLKLRQRILTKAERQANRQQVGPWRRSLWAALPLAAALVLALAGSSLGWSLHLQGRVQQLQEETVAVQRQLQFLNAQQSDVTGTLVGLSRQVGTNNQMLDEQRTVFAALASPDVRSEPLLGRGPAREASGIYFWSAQSGIGGLACFNLPMLPSGKAYYLWLLRDGEAYNGGSFQAWNGVGLHAINFQEMGIAGPFTAFGVSIEDAGSRPRAPTSALILSSEPAPNIPR